MGQLGAELTNAGYDVTVLTSMLAERSTNIYRDVKINGVNPHDMPIIIRNALSSCQYDVCLIAQDPLGGLIWSLEGLPIPDSLRLLIQPVINEQGYSRWRNHQDFSFRLANILRNADAVLVMTKNGPDKKFACQFGLNAAYLPNAAAFVAAQGNFREMYGIASDKRVILHVANVYAVKNHIGLMNHLRELPHNWHLVMVGNLSGEPECIRTFTEKLAERPDVLFIPGLPPAGISAAIDAADVVVLASQGEGSPLVILEAMSHRKPWIATPNCGAVNDHLGGIVSPLEQFRSYLKALFEHPDLLENLGRIGYEHWYQCYTWAVVIKGWVDLIEQGALQRRFEPSEHLVGEMKRVRQVLDGYVNTEPIGASAIGSSASFPLVSIVLPTYNHLQYLPIAVEAILGQTFVDYELIIINDGSTDETESYLATLEDVRIRVINRANGGLPSALNCGFSEAKGKYFTWTSADNATAPTWLGKLVSCLEGAPESVGFALSSFAFIDDQGALTRVRRIEEMQLDSLMAENHGIASFMYRASVAKQVGDYDEALNGAEDWDMWLRILEITDPACVGDVLYYYRVHSNSMTSDLKGTISKVCTAVLQKLHKRHGDRFDLDRIYPQLRLAQNQHMARWQAQVRLASYLINSPFCPLVWVADLLIQALNEYYSIDVQRNLVLLLCRHGGWDLAIQSIDYARSQHPSNELDELRSCVVQHDVMIFHRFPIYQLPDAELLFSRGREAAQSFCP